MSIMGTNEFFLKKTARRRAIRDSAGDRLFVSVLTVISFIILVLVLYPLIFVLSSSFSSGDAVMFGKVTFLPVEFSVEGYRMVLNEAALIRGFRNSLLYTSLGTTINIVMTTLLAFPLSRRRMPGSNVIMFLVVFTMFFSGGLIPTFLIVSRMGMIDTVWAMVIPNAISTFNLIIMRTYFQNSIPEELYESASLDGCGYFRYLIKIVLPLSKPILAVLVLYYAVGHWNSYFNALIYLRSSRLISLQLALRSILLANQITSSAGGEGFGEVAKIGLTVKYAVIVISSIPVIILYPFIQKYFIKGVMIGALKG